MDFDRAIAATSATLQAHGHRPSPADECQGGRRYRCQDSPTRWPHQVADWWRCYWPTPWSGWWQSRSALISLEVTILVMIMASWLT